MSIISTLVFAQATLRITIISDSTVCNYAASKYPQTGWGQVLERFFSTGSITVNNRAIGGRSTRMFYQEGRWAEIVPDLQKGEYVFIQFGNR
jgi:lysophospholipase L1-like esterase